MSQEIKVRGHFVAAGKPRKWGDGHYSTKFWIDINKDSKYPTMGEFDVYKDNVNLEKFKKGQEVDVFFNIKGAKREWEKDGKKQSAFFQTLDVWKIEQVGSSPSPSPEHPDYDSDGLPF